MPVAALEAEVEASMAEVISMVDEHGRRLVVRNGYAVPRPIVMGAGPIVVEAPRVIDSESLRRPGNVAGSLRRS